MKRENDHLSRFYLFGNHCSYLNPFDAKRSKKKKKEKRNKERKEKKLTFETSIYYDE